MPPAPFITLNEETMVIEAFDLTEDAIGVYELTLDVELDQSSADEEQTSIVREYLITLEITSSADTEEES